MPSESPSQPLLLELPVLPLDVVYVHILPKCNIDTRLAFGIRPARLNLQFYETGDFAASLKRRFTISNVDQYNNGICVQVPIHTIDGWLDKETQKHAMVNLWIHYDFKWYRACAADSIRITVARKDYREPNKTSELVARMWVKPRQAL